MYNAVYARRLCLPLSEREIKTIAEASVTLPRIFIQLYYQKIVYVGSKYPKNGSFCFENEINADCAAGLYDAVYARRLCTPLSASEIKAVMDFASRSLENIVLSPDSTASLEVEAVTILMSSPMDRPSGLNCIHNPRNVERCATVRLLKMFTRFNIWSRVESPYDMRCLIRERTFANASLLSTQRHHFWCLLLFWVMLQNTDENVIVLVFSGGMVMTVSCFCFVRTTISSLIIQLRNVRLNYLQKLVIAHTGLDLCLHAGPRK